MKTAIVTGASGGIGLAVTENLIRNGYFVAGFYNKNGEVLDKLKNSLSEEKLDGQLIYFKADFNKEEEIFSAYEGVKKNFKHIDLLVNNAGIALYKLVTDTTVREWDSLFNVNVRSAFILSKCVLNDMIKFGTGNIVNISSVWGKVGASMETVYSASKAALIGFTKALAKEVSGSGIRVNCICPGVIDTKMNAVFSETEIDDMLSKIPLDRIGTPKEVADLVTFLSSDRASFITGEVVTIDGGFSL